MEEQAEAEVEAASAMVAEGEAVVLAAMVKGEVMVGSVPGATAG